MSTWFQRAAQALRGLKKSPAEQVNEARLSKLQSQYPQNPSLSQSASAAASVSMLETMQRAQAELAKLPEGNGKQSIDELLEMDDKELMESLGISEEEFVC